MAWPSDYIENPRPCIGGENHQWSSMGHPLSHSCIRCHKPRHVIDPIKRQQERDEAYWEWTNLK